MGAAVIFPAGAAIKRAADFEHTMQAIGNTADMTKPQIAALGLEILKISDESKKSAQTVQQAMGYLVAAGMDVGVAAAVLRPVGRTATATASEIEDVAKATFTLNDALKIQPQGMQRALDMLVQAGKEGNFEFKDMAAELPVLAAGMQSLKMTGGEAVATLGAALQIARKGAGSSQQAATNVENFLAKVMSPETLKKAQKNFGVDLYKIISTAQKNGQNPFEAAVMAINKMTKGGDQKLLGELFQDMQVQNFLRPMLQNLEEYQRIKKAALSADGVVDRDFEKMAGTLKVQMEESSNAVGRLAIALGNSLAPAVGAVLSVITPVVRAVASFTEQNPRLVGSTVMVVAGLFALRTAALVGSFAMTFIRGAALSTALSFTRLAPVITAVGTALRFAGTAVMFLGRMLLLNPIGLAVTVIAGAVFLIYKYWGPLSAWFTELWGGIRATFASVYDWIVGKVAYLMELPGRIKSKFGSLFGGDAQHESAAGAPSTMDGFNLPDVPPVVARGGTTVNDNSQTTVTIVQQPGQDGKALYDQFERERNKRAGIRARSSLVDGVGAQ
jgi:TP901 family phage tail tape measure protein